MNEIFDPTFIASLIVVITIHEFSHAATANYLGDPTPRLQGRLTLNPLAHLDPIGSLVFIITSLSGTAFGWGRPVQFDPYNLQKPKTDSAIISLAGPASNLFTALVLSIIIQTSLLNFIPSLASILIPFFVRVIIFSVVLAIFNLLPIHPLDGGKILVGLLPFEKAKQVDNFLKQYGTLILIFLLLTGSFSIIISPIINLLLSFLLPTVNLI